MTDNRTLNIAIAIVGLIAILAVAYYLFFS